MKWENKGHEFDLIAEHICSKNNLYYIWGAGVFGETFLKKFESEINIAGFIDSSTIKQGKEISGKYIYSPEILDKKNESIIVLVSAGWTREIFTELKNKGFRKNIDFFHIDEFTAIYMMYQYDKITFTDVTYAITEKCTLKCKDCNSFMPHYRDSKNYPLESIQKNLSDLFKWVDIVNVFGLCGGDAMVHPQFNTILEYIGEQYYPDRICNIEVYSNAVIIPNHESLDLMKKYNVYYRFSDYLPYTEGKQKIDQVISILDEYGIRYDHVKFDKWCDCGYPQLSNGITDEKDLVEFFNTCDRRSCHILTDRGLIFCGMAHNADRIGYCQADSDDYMELSKYDKNRRMELLEFMLGYSNKGYLSYCKVCNGGANVNTKFVEAGEQLR